MKEERGKMSQGQGYKRSSTESLPGNRKPRVRARRWSRAAKGIVEIADD